jgi:hypothetical protein
MSDTTYVDEEIGTDGSVVSATTRTVTAVPTAEQMHSTTTVLRAYLNAIDAGETPTAAQTQRALAELIRAFRWYVRSD